MAVFNTLNWLHITKQYCFEGELNSTRLTGRNVVLKNIKYTEMDVCFPGIEKKEITLETGNNNLRKCHVSELVPHELCPVAYNHLVPYIQTLLGDGWFSWVTKSRDTSYRREIHAGDFSRKSINRLYANEVLVQCPSNDARIVFGVGIKGAGAAKVITVRVMSACGDCPRHHKPSEIIEISAGEFPFSPVEFSSIFPYLLASEAENGPFFIHDSNSHDVVKVSSSPSDKAGQRVCLSEEELSTGEIAVESITFPCRYHRKPDTFGENDFTIDDLCPNALYAAYPDGLALLYQEPGSSRTIRCPDTKGGVVFSIQGRPRLSPFLSSTLSLINRFMNRLGHPLDILERDVDITVIETAGECPRNHKKGDVFSLNLENDKKLCPASFYSLFPFYLANRKKKSECFSLPCPDCVGTTYKVS